MKIVPAPGAPRARVIELGLTLLVLAGVVNCIHRFVIDGKLPQPFIFDITDTFMDWFNTAYWAHNEGAFTIWRTVYPPLSFAFLRIFGISRCYESNPATGRECDWIGVTTIVICYIISVLLASYAFYRKDPTTAVFRSISFGLGLPLVFTLERGNLILVAFIFFVIAHGEITRSRGWRAIGIAIGLNFKPYLLLPALALAFKRRWRALEIAGIATVAVYIISYAMVGSGSIFEIAANTAEWVTFVGGLLWEQVYYTTSYAPFLEFNTHRFPTRDFLPSEIVDNFLGAITPTIRITQFVLAVTLIGAWLQPQALTTSRISFLLFAFSLIGQSPGGYTLTFLLFLVFLEPWKRRGAIVALIMAYLQCIPYDYVVANIITLSGNAWLSGRPVTAPFGLSLGIFIRPGLILIMTWALALDSLAQIIRAHRETRPTLDPHPDAMLGRTAA